MPQMSPMLWLWLYMYIIMMFIIFISLIYFMVNYKMIYKSIKNYKLILYQFTW
uniref:ATP synthase F0 subunit 8 n=1 Tax=Pachyneuron aphidis TaxID=909094 RepID=A0A6G6D9T6_9HYME|nr:ATP synthase F0 subunit 8 [Pachyneuron aphidis]